MSEENIKADFHRERFKFRFLDLTERAIAKLKGLLQTPISEYICARQGQS
jgi:hypothetical protein